MEKYPEKVNDLMKIYAAFDNFKQTRPEKRDDLISSYLSFMSVSNKDNVSVLKTLLICTKGVSSTHPKTEKAREKVLEMYKDFAKRKGFNPV